MNSTEIKALLEKYFTADVTQAEEKQLLDLFTSGDYPPEFESEAIMFQYFDWEARERKKDPAFEKELREIINSIPDPLHKRKIRRVSWLAAATILLLAGLTVTFRQIHSIREEAASMRNTQLAYEQFQTAIFHMSSNFDSGLENLQHLNMYSRTFGTVDHFTHNYQYQIFNINPSEAIRSQNQQHEKVN